MGDFESASNIFARVGDSRLGAEFVVDFCSRKKFEGGLNICASWRLPTRRWFAVDIFTRRKKDRKANLNICASRRLPTSALILADVILRVRSRWLKLSPIWFRG